MGVIVNKENEKNDELSRRISADLRTKQVAEAKGDDVDFAEDAAYMKDLKKTGRFGWVWAVLIALAILSIISIVMI